MRLIFAALCGFVLTTSQAQKFDTTFYSNVSNGFITGAQKSWKENNNEFHYIYYYNDRGRGQNIHEKVITNNNGQIISSETSGVDYTKSPYHASFSIINDSAVWITNGIRKTKKNNNEVYGHFSSPGAQELIMNWVLKQPGRKAYTFPDDSLRMSEPIIKKMNYKNKTLALKLCTTYYGQSPDPDYTWFTPNMTLFAAVGNWGGIILKGYEDWIDTLVSLQELASASIYTDQVKQYSAPLKKSLLITHATLFNSSDASVQNNMSVEVVNGKIISIFSSDNKIHIHADSTIDAKGKFLMPGLWDMHGHYGKTDGVWYLAGGVTHVRDMGNTSIVQTW